MLEATTKRPDHVPAPPRAPVARTNLTSGRNAIRPRPSQTSVAALTKALGNRAVGRIQAKLTVGAPDDAYEREADRIAERVVATGNGRAVTDCVGGFARRVAHVQRKCEACENDENETTLRRAPLERKVADPARTQGPSESGTPAHPAVAGELRTARSSGRPLGPERAFFESRLGHDLSGVRIHDDPPAQRLAEALSARAFTFGRDIFFHRGQFQPGTADGKRLLAHELVHTVQQGATSSKEGASSCGVHGVHRGQVPPSRVYPRIQRAQFDVGSVTIHVDYGGLHAISDADLVGAIESRFLAFTVAPDASAIHTSLVALTSAQRRWVLYALDLLQDNTRSPLHDRLDRTTAVQRLIAHAPSAAHTFPGALGPSEEEALRAAGWLEVALAAGFGRPSVADRARIREILNPPPAGGPGAALDVSTFRARMDPAVRHLINALDPANFPAVGTRHLPTLQALGDTLMLEARAFFSPYAHTARTSVFGLNPPFHISVNIFSVTALVPNRAVRLSYLRNRATIVGRNTSTSPLFMDRNIFHEVNFDGNRPQDRVEFEALIVALEADPAVAAAVDRLIQHTGRQSGSGAATRIGLSTQYNAASQTSCQARWSVIDTLCHEIMHAMAHPDFTNRASSAGFGQVLIEGVPEVLSTQMFNQHVKPKAGADAAFKARMELGIAPPPCPVPPDSRIGYGAAGAGAERIRTRPGVGDDKLRAAFFLGQVHLIGL
jgi:hypothetical protein